MSMKTRLHISMAIALALMAFTAGAQDLALSTGETMSVGGATCADHEVAAHTGASTFTSDITGLTSALPAGADIDALDYIDPMRVYFSLDADTDLGGTVYADEDVILWDVTFSSAWDGSANGLPAGADLDALDVISEGPLVFSFSLDIAANLTGPGLIADEDLVRWDGSSFAAALDFDGSAEGVPDRLDLDAFNRRTATEWVLSFDCPATIDTVAIDDEDLATFNSATGQFTGLFFDGSSEGLVASVDLNAAEATPNQVPIELSVFNAD